MFKKWCLTIVFMFVLIIMCGCFNSHSLNESNSKLSDNTKILVSSEESTDKSTDKFDVYELDSEDSRFNTEIANNAIDKAYKEDIEQAVTVDEMVKIETKYISIWEEELDYTVANYMAVLSEEDQISFENAQVAFEEYATASFEYDTAMLLQNKYNIHMGTISRWLLYVAHKNAIRERTIHIKYLHYLVESAMDGAQTYSSLTFHFPGL